MVKKQLPGSPKHMEVSRLRASHRTGMKWVIYSVRGVRRDRHWQLTLGLTSDAKNSPSSSLVIFGGSTKRWKLRCFSLEFVLTMGLMHGRTVKDLFDCKENAEHCTRRATSTTRKIADDIILVKRCNKGPSHYGTSRLQVSAKFHCKYKWLY